MQRRNMPGGARQSGRRKSRGGAVATPAAPARAAVTRLAVSMAVDAGSARCASTRRPGPRCAPWVWFCLCLLGSWQPELAVAVTDVGVQGVKPILGPIRKAGSGLSVMALSLANRSRASVAGPLVLTVRLNRPDFELRGGTGRTAAGEPYFRVPFGLPKKSQVRRVATLVFAHPEGQRFRRSFATLSVFQNSRPSANAGRIGAIFAGQAAQLDGSSSVDADGDALTYRWRLIARPARSEASILAPDRRKTSFMVDQPGAYTAELVVSDALEASMPATLTLDTHHNFVTIDAIEPDSGPSSTDFIVNGRDSVGKEARLLLRGSAGPVVDSVRLEKAGSGEPISAGRSVGGTWSVNVNRQLSEGSNVFTAIAYDKQGNEVARSDARAVVLDTQANVGRILTGPVLSEESLSDYLPDRFLIANPTDPASTDLPGAPSRLLLREVKAKAGDREYEFKDFRSDDGALFSVRLQPDPPPRGSYHALLEVTDLAGNVSCVKTGGFEARRDCDVTDSRLPWLID